MNAIQVFSGQPWVERVGWTLVHSLWQGALIAALYAIGRSRVGPSRSPQARYLLACAALAVLIAAPIATFSRAGIPIARQHHELSTTDASPPPIVPPVFIAPPRSAPWVWIDHAWIDPVMPWLVMAWLTGTLVFWIRLVGGWVVAERMRTVLARPAPLEWQRTFDQLKNRVRVSRPVKLLISPLVQAPNVVGWLRPVVLVPVAALAGLPCEHLEALLAHELAHIRRHDYLINLLQSIAEALLFYHPAVWWISGHIRSERELCCDDVALLIGGDALVYARALADLESYRSANSRPPIAANGGSLPERIGRILGHSAPQARHLAKPGVAASAMVLAVAAWGLFAQSPDDQRSFEVVSVKPSRDASTGSDTDSDGRIFKARNVTLQRLVALAYGIGDYRVEGPGWLGTERFDVDAKFPTDTPAGGPKAAEALRGMMQNMLMNRFRLVVHRSQKTLPVYGLVVAKSGLKVSEVEHGANDSSSHNEHYSGTSITMAEFAEFLSRRADLPVVDMTGLKGFYTFTLDWTPEPLDEKKDPALAAGGNPSWEALREAVETKLGLRFENRKAPIEIVVVDRADKTPTAN